MTKSSQLYTTEKLPGEPVILATLHAGYDMIRDLPKSSATAIALLDQMSEPVYYIVDLRELTIDMDVIVNGTNGASGSEGSLYRHPMVHEVLFVSPHPIASHVAEGLNNDAFGHVRAHAFATLDDAFDYVYSG